MKLKELCNVTSSKRIFASQYQNSGIPFYRGKEISLLSNNEKLKQELYISEELYQEINKKYGVPKKDDILMTAVGTIGNCYIVKDEKIYFKDGNIIWLKDIDSKKILPKYLYYHLNLNSTKNTIDSLLIGSTQKALTIESFKNIEIDVPNIEIQFKIVNLLNILSNKIRLNTDVNNNLLEIIDNLYKNEFIDIQEYKRAEEIANITIGKTPPRGNKKCFSTNKEDVKWVSIADLGKCGTYILDTSEKLTKEAVDSYNVKVIPKNTIILSFKLTVGRIAITSQEMTTNEAIAHFNLENKDMIYYLYSYLKNFDYGKLGSTSSIATAVNSKIIKAMPIAIPEKEALKNYNEKVSSMFEKIRENEIENKNLEQLRDTILPKLMNGEIDLDNIEI